MFYPIDREMIASSFVTAVSSGTLILLCNVYFPPVGNGKRKYMVDKDMVNILEELVVLLT